MSIQRKIILSLPDTLLTQIDRLSEVKGTNRSALVRDALALLLEESRKEEIRTMLVRGYAEMGELNLSLAEQGLAVDVRELSAYEQELKRKRKKE